MLFIRTPLNDDRSFDLLTPGGTSWIGGRSCGSPVGKSGVQEERVSPKVVPFLESQQQQQSATPGARDEAMRRKTNKVEEVEQSQQHPAPPATMNGTHDRANGLVNGHSTAPDKKPQTTFDTNTASTNGHSTPALARKKSNPLAPAFIVSAPGKTIVYGEHAVVHGKAAIAAAISLRSYLLVTALSKSHRTVALRFPDIGLDHTWNIADLPWKAFAHPDRKKKYYDRVTALDEELAAAMAPFIAGIGAGEKGERRKIQQSAASAFLYLFLSLGSEHSPPCVYALRSTIPVGAGLGSSASVSVCLATALLVQCRALSGPHPDQQSEEAEKQLERINRWAFVGELLIHGNPSGVDNTVATNGHAVLFQRKDYARPPSVSILREFPELPLLLINTCQPRTTAAEVAKVAHLKSLHPVVVENILTAIDSLTRSVYERLQSEDFDANSPENLAHLGELMALNHGLLVSLGVSHPRLERLRYLVDRSGVGWTKLTGAGGGGCAITLLKPEFARGSQGVVAERKTNGEAQLNGDAAHPAMALDYSTPQTNGEMHHDSALETLERYLEEEGFVKYETTLGGDGVGVLSPAILNDEEIDLEMFLTAETREDVERLVGGGREREEWGFWRP